METWNLKFLIQYWFNHIVIVCEWLCIKSKEIPTMRISTMDKHIFFISYFIIFHYDLLSNFINIFGGLVFFLTKLNISQERKL